ncbi:hypothetical protein [Pseudomonas sp. UBA2684]|uniref:hypothetical protein n=1 Tax=Pseudomonas sp. UBA2684 TaxID=1947311 RepID=UPI0025CD38B4|nr:hypothetical protein [Pseudomonas sp. UBA2684]|tara:strand:- start:744 stop:983 length:240 start_codon:yes stop_codon:yes gene_type:complete
MNLYDGHRVEDHAAFLFDDLLPAVVGYADSKGVPVGVVAFAACVAMAGVMVIDGVERDEIIRAIEEMRVPANKAPEAMR